MRLCCVSVTASLVTETAISIVQKLEEENRISHRIRISIVQKVKEENRIRSRIRRRLPGEI